jgi:predicted nuclease with TOPRIM domain
MNNGNPKSVRDYLAGLALAGVFEIEELRRIPMDVKLRQIWSLMTSASLLETDAEREASVNEVRERWRRIRQALEPLADCCG